MTPRELNLILTDYALHTNKKRAAKTYEAAISGQTAEGIPYGRFYGSMNKNGQFEIAFPQDMLDQINRGELIVRCFVQKEGTPVFAGEDTVEKIAQINKKKRNMGVHSARVHKKRHTGV
jgi:hypothetical protein